MTNYIAAFRNMNDISSSPVTELSLSSIQIVLKDSWFDLFDEIVMPPLVARAQVEDKGLEKWRAHFIRTLLDCLVIDPIKKEARYIEPVELGLQETTNHTPD